MVNGIVTVGVGVGIGIVEIAAAVVIVGTIGVVIGEKFSVQLGVIFSSRDLNSIRPKFSRRRSQVRGLDPETMGVGILPGDVCLI